MKLNSEPFSENSAGRRHRFASIDLQEAPPTDDAKTSNIIGFLFYSHSDQDYSAFNTATSSTGKYLFEIHLAWFVFRGLQNKKRLESQLI